MEAVYRLHIPNNEQGRIHGNPVADGWAGAVMRKSLGVQKCYRPTDLPTDMARCRVACPRLKSGGRREKKRKKKEIVRKKREKNCSKRL